MEVSNRMNVDLAHLQVELSIFYLGSITYCFLFAVDGQYLKFCYCFVMVELAYSNNLGLVHSVLIVLLIFIYFIELAFLLMQLFLRSNHT